MTTQVDMLVGDIYGDRDYSSIGLSATTIASSFGKVVSQVRAAGILHTAVLCMIPPLHLYHKPLHIACTSAVVYEAESLSDSASKAREAC